MNVFKRHTRARGILRAILIFGLLAAISVSLMQCDTYTPQYGGGNTPGISTNKPITENGICYTPEKSGWSAKVADDFSGTSLTIPATFQGKPVLAITSLAGAEGIGELTLELSSEVNRWSLSKLIGEMSSLTTCRIDATGTKLVIDKETFANCSSLQTLELLGTYTIESGMLDNCTNIRNLTLGGGKVKVRSYGLSFLTELENLSFLNGTIILENSALANELSLQTLTIDGMTSDSQILSAGFYSLQAQNATIRNSTVSLSSSNLFGTYAMRIGTLTLCEGAHVSAVVPDYGMIEKLILDPSFTFENGSAKMTYKYGLVASVPIAFAEEVHIHKGITFIPAYFFGESGCDIYYEGLSDEFFSSVHIEQEGNSSYLEGNLCVYGIDDVEYILSFDSAGGSKIPAQTVPYSQCAAMPAEPTRPGYVFRYWATDAAGEHAWDFVKDQVKGDITLYAIWLDLAPFSDCELLALDGFEKASDGTYEYAGAVKIDTQQIDLSDTITVSEYATYTLHRAEDDEQLSASEPISLIDGDNTLILTVCSGNQKNTKTYTLHVFRPFICHVTFDAGNGEEEIVSVEYGNTLSYTDPKKTGFTFDGWYADNTLWNLEKTPVTSSMKLKAKWIPNTYTVTLEGHGSVKLTYQEDYTLPVPTKQGLSFGGWSTADGTLVTDREGRSLRPWHIAANAPLTPYFTALTYKITYTDLHGAKHANPETQVSDAELVLGDAARKGYEFKGWLWNGKTVTSIPIGNTEDVVLQAKWSPIAYQITYQNTLGMLAGVHKTFTVEDSVDLPTLTAEGRTFNGWLWNGLPVTTLPKGTVGDVTLYASWTGDSYKIMYLGTQDATHSCPDTYVSYTKTPLKAATRTGFVFLGWELNGQIVTAIPDNITGDITLTATWEPISYTVTFCTPLGDVIEVQHVEHGKDALPPEPPTVEHMLFARWDGDYQNVTEDRTLRAVYRENVYYVSFNPDGGSSVTILKVWADECPEKPTDPTKGELTFEGWYLPTGKLYQFDYPLNENTMLTAGWRDYTPIYTAEDFALMEGSSGKFKLMNDVNFYNEAFTPISEFMGIFDGCGHTISAFSLDGTESLAMILNNQGTVKNLTIKRASLQSAPAVYDTNCAILVAVNSGTIENCRFVDCTVGIYKSVEMRNHTSSVICAGNQGTVKNCTVQNPSLTLAFEMWSSQNENVYFGLIVGNNLGTVSDCTVNVDDMHVTLPYNLSVTWGTGYAHVGGIVGSTEGAVERCHCSWSPEITSVESTSHKQLRLGSLAGQLAKGTIQDCTAIFDIAVMQELETYDRASFYVSGAVGVALTGTEIKNCAVFGRIERNEVASNVHYTSGFVGSNDGKITNCYAVASILAGYDAHAAGFCTENTVNGTIRSCFFSGYLHAKQAEALDTFTETNTGTVLDCFFDQSSKLVGSSNKVVDATDDAASPKSIAELTSPEFLFDTLYWNPSVWECESDRLPTLKNLTMPDTLIVLSDRCEYSTVSEMIRNVTAGEQFTLTATPHEGYRFIGWCEIGSDTPFSTDQTCTITVKEGMNVIFARFEPDDLYIYTYDDLLKINLYSKPGQTVYLMASINCMGKPLPSVENFYGTLDGNGHAIYNFATTLTSSGDAALILNNYGTVRNLQLSGSMSVNAGVNISRIAFIAVVNHQGAVIENCAITGMLKVAGTLHLNGSGSMIVYAGAFAAENAGTIQNCVLYDMQNSPDINDRMYFDVNMITSLAITEGYRSISTTLHCGFIAGYNQGTILNCENRGAILGDPEAPARFENNISAYYTGLLAPDATAAGYMTVALGGIAGTNDGTLEACTDDSVMYVLDLAGTDIHKQIGAPCAGIQYGYLRSDVNIGGVAGNNNGTISGTLAIGLITYSSDNVNNKGISNGGLFDGLRSNLGGITGTNNGTVQNSSFGGVLVATTAQTTYVGAISGYNTGSVVNCYGSGLVMAEALNDKNPVYLNLTFWKGFGVRHRSGNVAVGGMVGMNADSAIISNCLSNYHFDRLQSCTTMSDYEIFVNILLIPKHVQNAFMKIFDAPPVYANILRLGTVVGDSANQGNIQNCYYVMHGEYDYTDGRELTNNVGDLTSDMIKKSLYWSVTEDNTAAADHDWLMIKESYLVGGDPTVYYTVHIIPRGTVMP